MTFEIVFSFPLLDPCRGASTLLGRVCSRACVRAIQEPAYMSAHHAAVPVSQKMIAPVVAAILCAATRTSILEASQRPSISSLLLGLYDEEKRLVYVGTVGTGFSHAEAEELYTAVNRLQVGRCPFRTMPSVRGSVSWCRPTVVCQVRYRELTVGGKLRNSVHITIQEDYDPAEYILSQAPSLPSTSR